MINCNWWVIQGLYAKGGQFPSEVDQISSEKGTVFLVRSSNNITIKRNLVATNNRSTGFNAGGLSVQFSSNVLVEENEVYDVSRHHIQMYHTTDSVVRRNYANIRNAPASNSGCISIYSTNSRIITENNIAEGCERGIMLAHGTDSPGNKFYGNIAYGTDKGFAIAGVNTVVMDGVVVNPGHWNIITGRGVWSQMTLLGGSSTGYDIYNDNAASGDFNWSSGPDPCNVTLTNILAAAPTVSNNYGIFTSTTQGASNCMWALDHPVANGYSINFSPTIPNANVILGSTASPSLGSCKVWIPDSSPLKRAGKNGADIGANVLYRYQDGVLTTQPLWNTTTGEFPHGAIVAGVNDIAGSSAFDVHQRLNVNTNGCPFPAGYVSVTPPPTPTPTPSPTPTPTPVPSPTPTPIPPPPPPADTTPPTISNSSASSITTNSATITWNTSEMSTHQVEYGLTSAYELTTPQNNTLMTAHSEPLSSLDILVT